MFILGLAVVSALSYGSTSHQPISPSPHRHLITSSAHQPVSSISPSADLTSAVRLRPRYSAEDGQATAGPLPFLSPIFSSHMVLQRDRANTFWGWGKAGERVTVTVAGRHADGTADVSGKWTARISPPPTGGPYTVDVDGTQHVHLDDVLVGDVWVCSGQSNMEMGIGMVRNSQAEIAAANFPGIRLFMVQKSANASAAVVPNGTWAVCTPQSVAAGGWGGFSAAGYFFGRHLHQELKIPIGLVDTCWGGTPAEAWVSQSSLGAFKEFQPAIATLNAVSRPGEDSTAQKFDKWMRANDPGSAKGDDWAATGFDDGGWKPAPSTSYQAMGLGRFSGVVWFRQEVTLPDPLPPGPLQLQLGNIRDMETTWFNGTRVGEHYTQADWSQFAVDASLLKPGRNVVTVRVLNTNVPGFLSNPGWQNIWLSNGTQISLSKGWKFWAGADMATSKPLPQMFTGDPNVPTVLNNGMIAPIVPLAMKGAIWYQGESNVGRAPQYAKLLPTLIGDWRRSWGQGDFPFFVVQLANFSTRHPQPVDDGWAELRESQADTVQHVRNTGLAVAIDIGDGADIHPKDKQDVGLRLALAALHVAYGQNLPYSGPILRSTRRDGPALRLRFDHADGGLRAGGDKLAGFQIAGSDHKFYWADAQIQGNEVLVSSPSVPEPVAVRYAWDANPEATLYNGAGLPAIPFRTDR